MKRLYDALIKGHLREYRQMIFLAGPRQVGKTTLVKGLKEVNRKTIYFNWDNQDDRMAIVQGPAAVAQLAQLDKARNKEPILIFDEIHRYGKWKLFLKGFFDVYGDQCKIVVTGSAKLNIYKSGGDSLMGRYFLYHIFPFSVGEIVRSSLPTKEISKPKKLSDSAFRKLLKFGGFPEPYIRGNLRFAAHWQRLRRDQLIQEDIRDLSQVQELSQLEILAQVLRDQVSQSFNYRSLAAIVNVSNPTIKRWMKCLESFYYCFSVKPWSKNVRRSLRKEPKYYLWDWSLAKESGARYENFVASHLMKAVQFWTDYGFGEYGLYYIRDKEKREVDFLISKNGEPFFLVEVKSASHSGLTKSLCHFFKEIGAKHAFQVVFDQPYVEKDVFSYKKPVIVPATTFLSQLI